MNAIAVWVLSVWIAWVAQTGGAPTQPNLVEARKLVVEASTLLEQKEYAKAAERYVQAIEAGPTSPTTRYNAACCFARTGKTDDAFQYLDQAIEQGWNDAAHLGTDPDLDSLRTDPRWNGVVAACHAQRESYRKSLGNAELYDELKRRVKIDQDARTANPIDVEALTRIDQDNTAWMKGVIDKHGWPGFAMVGKDGAQGAWLLVQHADLDTAFQRRCLDLMTAAVERNDVTPVEVAYLTDRVLLAEGKSQVYGTQFWTVEGELRPRPIEDEPNVDARRAKVGLEPIAVYAERMKALEQK